MEQEVTSEKYSTVAVWEQEVCKQSTAFFLTQNVPTYF